MPPVFWRFLLKSNEFQLLVLVFGNVAVRVLPPTPEYGVIAPWVQLCTRRVS